MRVFSKGSDSEKCPTVCCSHKVLVITLRQLKKKKNT